MATNRQKLFLAYFLSKATFFGIGYSRLFDITSNDTWISIILGMLLGILIVYIISKIMDYKKDTSLREFLEEKSILNVVIKFFIILLCLYVFLEEIMILTNFMNSFYLLNTPSIFICIPIMLVIFYVLKKGLKSLLKTNEILFYISIFITIITYISLSNYPNIDYLQPLLINKYSNIIYSAFIFATYSTVPLLFLTNLKNNGKGLIMIYLISSLRILLMCLFITTIFGPELTKIYRFPEYIVLKRIKILSFVEKIESLLSIIYIFDNYILMEMSSYTIFSLTSHRKKLKWIPVTLIVLTTLFSNYFLSSNYAISLRNYYLSIYFYVTGIIIIILLIIKALKKKHTASNPT